MTLGQITTHETLLTKLASGKDEEAWREFCSRYGDLIRAFGKRRGLQEADREEVLQEVLTALTKAMRGFRYDPAKGKFRSYLKTVVLHVIFQRARQNRHEASLGHDGDVMLAVNACPEAEDAWEEEWRQYHLGRAMGVVAGEVHEVTMAVFKSYVVEGRGAQETAKALGVTLDQVYHAKSRILQRLTELVEQQIAEEG